MFRDFKEANVSVKPVGSVSLLWAPRSDPPPPPPGNKSGPGPKCRYLHTSFRSLQLWFQLSSVVSVGSSKYRKKITPSRN
jgi:hypothetical protein